MEVFLQFQNVVNYWNILTNRMHNGFSSRSTVHVGRPLFVRLSFPTFASSGGEPLCGDLVLSVALKMGSSALQ